MWKNEAACRNMGIELFFSRRTSKAGEQAVAVCSTCPVKQHCLEDAMSREKSGFRLGIWGGLGPAEREKLHGER